MRGILRHPKLSRVTIQHSQVFVDLGIIFQHAGSVINLDSGRFGRPNAIVEFTPGRVRQIRTYGSTMTNGQVTFNQRDIFQNWIALVQNFCNFCNFSIRVKSLGNVNQVRKLGAIVGYESHDLFLDRWVVIPEK